MSRYSKPISANAVALAAILSDEEIANLLENARQKERDRLDAIKNEKNSAARRKIADLLTVAQNSLIEAGNLAKEHRINFSFASPNGGSISFDDWNESACYASDGWYYDDPVSTVENVPINAAKPEDSWYSSSNDC
jgi:hypothetical protein